MGTQQKRKRPEQAHSAAPEVVYTPPEPLDRKKLILRLTTVAALVLALFLGFSIFFRVDRIVVTGTNKYTEWAIREASGIEEGESLLTFGKAKAAGKITGSLPYVKSVRIGVTLPGTVNIYVEELEVVYSALDEAGSWWLISADGRLVEQTSQTKAKDNTILKGFTLLEPVVGQQAEVVEPDPDVTVTGPAEEPTMVTVTNKERLDTVLAILTRLELNGVLGKAASIDVTDMGNIELWYGAQYQVKLGDAGLIDEKIDDLCAAIKQLGSHQSGILDITYTVEPEGVRCLPFE